MHDLICETTNTHQLDAKNSCRVFELLFELANN